MTRLKAPKGNWIKWTKNWIELTMMTLRIDLFVHKTWCRIKNEVLFWIELNEENNKIFIFINDNYIIMNWMNSIMLCTWNTHNMIPIVIVFKWIAVNSTLLLFLYIIALFTLFQHFIPQFHFIQTQFKRFSSWIQLNWVLISVR